MDDAELTFPGDGEMSRRMRALDWSATPLGDPATWPASLRTACRIILTSRFPMVVFWGERLHFLYNDDYLPFLGTKHPALAKPAAEVWDEIWDVIGPMLDSVRDSGQPTWQDRQLLTMNRLGYWEETYWTYSFSPLHDDAGVVRGVFTAATDATASVIGERRLAVLNELGALAGRARGVAEACELVGQMLARAHQDVPFAAVYLRRPQDGELERRVVSPPGTEPAAAADGPGGWPLASAAAGRAVRVTDVADRFGPLPSGGWPTPPAQAMVLPLAGEAGGPVLGVIVAAASAGRALDEAYESFLGLLAQQAASVINSALAYQAQRRRAEELAELDRAKTVFFANVSHEFRTPLTLIMGPLADLRTRLAGQGAAVRGNLDIIHRNGLRLGKLVSTLLDFSRIEAGQMQPQLEPVDLAALTADLAALFRPAVEQAGLAFEVDCPPLPGPVWADREMWEQVVLNLLSNALKFTLDGSISVSLRAAGGRAVLRVADTGAGVPAAEIPRLFERFHRVPSVRARSSEGSGIGLALVREFVSMHDGTVAADSAEGAGTVFTVALPLRRDDLTGAGYPAARRLRASSEAAEPFLQEVLRWLPAEDAAALDESLAAGGGSAPGRPAGAPGPPARVLLADDNADMRQYLQRLLAPHYQVTAVTDGQAALAAARADPPDLIVSDVMMPGLDGLQLVGALRAETRTAAVPVLLLSARTGEEAAIEGLDAGADDYLVKPFPAGELLARVRANVQLARLRSHQARWQAAVIDSLQEAFFIMDDAGAIGEINAAFTGLLGFGPDGLPYRPPYPWRPPDAHPEAHHRADEAFAQLLAQGRGSMVVPAVHRHGRLLWMAASVAEITDPVTGRRRVAGTFRDVTAEHYAGQRESALAAMGIRLARATSVPDAVTGAVSELRDLWHARRVLAATWARGDEPALAAAPAARWADLPGELREQLSALRGQPPLRPAAAGAATGIVLEHPDGLLALWIELDPAVPFTAEDATLLALLGGHLVQAMHRIHQASQERETALALQRAILGPAVRPAGFAVRYEPAGRPLEVGGDWYDLVTLAGGRIAIVVGDCVSHGLAAATIMGQLRSACRALLLEENSPARVLAALDRFTELIPGGMCSTAFCAILDPATGHLTYSSAGHPPPILAPADGPARLLEDGRSLPLAVDAGAPRSDAAEILPAGSTLLLYTDGLIEHRRRPLDAGLAQAAAVLEAGLADGVEELASRLLASLTPAGGYEDDVALVLYRRPAAAGSAPPA